MSNKPKDSLLGKPWRRAPRRRAGMKSNTERRALGVVIPPNGIVRLETKKQQQTRENASGRPEEE